MKYNYVVWNANYEYYKIAFKELDKMENVRVFDTMTGYMTAFEKKVYRIHTHARINRKINIPFKGIWNKKFFKDDFKENRPLCFIFRPDQIWLRSYFGYLKKTYPDCKLVLISRDLFSEYPTRYYGFDLSYAMKTFDLILSYNKYDCDKYGFTFFNTEASMIPIEREPNYPISDVFFAGTAKDRLDELLYICHKFNDAGLKCDFYITGVKPEDRKETKGVIYADKWMSYTEMLRRSANSRCVLEVSQKNAYGFTSRAFEAIMYNVKLITNSLVVKDQKFYREDYIQFYDNPEDIDPEFVKRDVGVVDYHYNDEYSPCRTIELIEECLLKNNKN